MKTFRIYLLAAAFAGLSAAGCNSSQPEEAPFTNKLYFDGDSKTEKIPLKAKVVTAVRTLQVAAPKPLSNDVEVAYKDDASMVAAYNEGFYDNAVMLPAENYELDDTKARMGRGTLLSTPVQLIFKDLDKLSQTQTYVLPVTFECTEMPTLKHSRTRYYVLKSSPIIDYVADMENKNYVKFPSFDASKPSGEVCNNLNQFTLEALIRVRKFESRIQTILGIEEYFLLRISDNKLATNQLQYVTPYGKITNEQCLLTPGKWTHIAATFDMTTQMVLLYIDGVEVGRKENLTSAEPASFGKPMTAKFHKFCIGFSYAQGRELDGEFSECRIWNVVRTPKELADNVYEVDPHTPGLVAYWKFNEGKGRNITDRTGNLNDGVAAEAIKWTSVWLPAAE